MALSRPLCRSCRLTANQVRTFSATTSKLNVPPEAPHYIDVPQTVQEDQPFKRRARGVLPVPREIFPSRQQDKPSEAYLARATQDPREKRAPATELLAWKARMAETRKKHLREGLVELHKRKQNYISRVKARSDAKTSAREIMLSQPEREEDRLTKASILQQMKPIRGVLPNPNREVKLATKKANVEAKAAQKAERRRDSLHSLYMNARNFITTEEALAAEVDGAFPENGPNPDWVNSKGQESPNVWGLGPPPTVKDMIDSLTLSTNPERSEYSKLNSQLAQFNVAQQRLKKIAEELTGGKI